MIYLDSSAIVKLVAPEAETSALIAWMRARSDEALVTSMLAEVEVPRALRRTAPRRLGAVSGVLSRLQRIEINAEVRATAGSYMEPNLRSLDAIHTATADSLVTAGINLTAFITYDKRQAAAAAEIGLAVEAPGAS